MGLLSGLFGGGGQAAAGGGGGVGGFLSGLGQKAHDAWSGTTPELSIQQHPDLMDERLGPIHQMPSFTDTGRTTGGLLSKMQAPDDRGLTFGDKLFAAGNVLQGDSGGAATFLQNQRANADTVDQRMRATRLARSGANAFRQNMNPDGSLNFKGYADAMGDDFDPMAAMKLQDAAAPDYGVMSGARGAITAYDKHNPSSHFQVEAGDPQQPQMFLPDPASPTGWRPNPIYMQGVQDKAAAERAGKPLAPQRPRVGRAPAAPQPRATGKVY